MATLEDFDPTALPWEEWSDGRPRRLKRGKDYVGDVRAVQRAARAAAAELDKGVVTTSEQLAKWEWVWFQFADQSIEEGDPCRCGGRHFERHHVLFGHCKVCGRTTVLREPKEPVELPPATADGTSGGPLDPEFGRVVAVRIVSAEGQETNDVPIDAEAVFHGTFEAVRGGFLASPRVTLRTELVRAFVARPALYRRLERAGLYHFEMRLPPDILAPQTYSLEFNIRVRTPDRKKLLRGPPIPLNAFDPSGRGNRREGVVRPRFEWLARDEHGDEPLEEEHLSRDEPLDPDDGVPGGG